MVKLVNGEIGERGKGTNHSSLATASWFSARNFRAASTWEDSTITRTLSNAPTYVGALELTTKASKPPDSSTERITSAWAGKLVVATVSNVLSSFITIKFTDI